MGLLDCVASPEEKDHFDERQKPISRQRQYSRSDHNISKRRSIPLFASQTNLKNIRDVDFWRQKVVRFLFCPEGREDIRVLKVPFPELGYSSITDFVSSIPQEFYIEYHNQSPPDEGILKDDKVFWIRDGIAEPGTFKWQGVIDSEPCLGLQLDRKKAVPFGVHDGKGLFYCKPGHRAIVPEHEVTPYKKFLRSFLGVPPKKDSFAVGGSIRLSAKAIAAKNSKPGDRVYLPKEKKYAIVQWIGKIGGETVVDLVYEPPKPEAGKPLSPDEPCVSRTMSMGDYIDELGASEPNTPVAVQPQENVLSKVGKQQTPVQQHVAPPPPPPPAMSSDESDQDQSELSTSEDDDDDDDDDDSESEDDETIEVMVNRPLDSQLEVEKSDTTDSEDDINASENSTDDDSEDERDTPANPPQRDIPANLPPRDTLASPSQRDIPASPPRRETPASPPPKDVPDAKIREVKDDSELFEDQEELSPRLPSPKRKGFFKFSAKKTKQKPRSPLPKDNIEEEQIVPASPEPQKTPTKRSKSPNFFSNFKFKNANKKRKEKESSQSETDLTAPVSSEPASSAPVSSAPVQKKKTGKSEWGRLFKPRSKNQLEKSGFEDSRSPMECTTPIDDMVPPEKIPTPPPVPSHPEQFNERRIEPPGYLNLSPTVIEKQDQNRRKPSKDTVSSTDERVTADVVLSPRDETSESEESDTDEELDVRAEHHATKVELHETPTESESDSFDESETEEKPEVGVKVPAAVVPEVENYAKDPEHVEAKYPEQNKTSPVTSPKLSMDMLKESKVRNRPLSFGSFMARMKQNKKLTGSPPEPPEIYDQTIDLTPEKEPEKVLGSSTTETLQDELDATAQGYKALSESESSLSSAGVKHTDDTIEGSSGVVFEIKKTLVKPPKPVTPKVIAPKIQNEGNQEEIVLDLLEVKEPGLIVNSPPPAVPTEESPKRKNSRSRSFTFNFSKKRKSSHPQPPTQQDSTPTPTELKQSDEDLSIENEENIEPSQNEQSPAKGHEEKDADKKQSLASTFRSSFRRTFSLTKKKPSPAPESDEESVKSPTSTINRPRPVTLYFDNNEVVQKRNSFKSKRPASVVVDIKPWNARHGRSRSEAYSSQSSDGSPTSPSKSPNPALLPKQAEPAEVPKHRIFTTPSIFIKKTKKSDEETLLQKAPKAPNYKKWNFLSDSQPQTPKTPTTPTSAQSTPQNEQSPPLPTAPPPLPTAPPPSLRKTPSITASETSATSQATKLKSALKQRKEIDSIPQGLKINDRVLWYSGKVPVPGTVQRLFKDGTDKYTAMVKFDREVSDEPLRLTREGDAYIITVEELITPDMFGPEFANLQQASASPPPLTPTTSSVRFDGVNSVQEEQLSEVTVTKEMQQPEEEHDLPPAFQEEEVQMSCGFKRGIQCRDRSCCLETILFSLFYTTNIFDIAMLYANTSAEDSLSRNARIILRREIVDPLRRHGFCPATAVTKLRDAVKPLSNEWQTLSTDAEVMMFILFDRALKLGKFISYSNDMSDFLHQLVVDSKDLSKSTTVQHLFETSLHLMDRIKLRTIPTPALILEMPRSKDKLVQYHAVVPNLTLHVSHLLDDGHRLCICNVIAKYECRHCAANFGDQSIVYCDQCKGSADIIHFQLTHEADLLPLSQTLVVLDLVALICVKAGHYFSFVKCGNKKFSPWVFFDGGDPENPKVCIEENLGMWLERLEKYPGKYHDALQYPLLTHILQDSHICIYQSREKSSSV